MTATIGDGKKIAQILLDQCKERVRKLADKPPGLVVIIIGDNPASRLYVNNKIKACQEVGLYSDCFDLPADVPENEVLEKIATLNQDHKVHGILIQLPLPKHIDEQKVLKAISPTKDVDGFHYYNLGALLTGNMTFPPCTPYGIIKMIEHSGIDPAGKEAVVVGRSNIVGKPMAIMLLEKNATVTICTSKTQDLATHTRRADILVVATGRPQMITGDMIKPGAVVIDVGINRLDDGRLVGDVEFQSASQTASYITPVPGGVGPMTIASLIANTILSAENDS